MTSSWQRLPQLPQLPQLIQLIQLSSFTHAALLQVTDFKNDVILAEACRNDVDKFCSTTEPGGCERREKCGGGFRNGVDKLCSTTEPGGCEWRGKCGEAFAMTLTSYVQPSSRIGVNGGESVNGGNSSCTCPFISPPK